MDVSIIIPSHNEGELVYKTVQACRETVENLSYEVIVVDDASTDGSISKIRKQFPEVFIISNSDRLGGSPSRTKGVQRAQGDVLVFLDAHCRPEAGALEQLIVNAMGWDGDALFAPRIGNLDGEKWTYLNGHFGYGMKMDLPTIDNRWIDERLLTKIGDFYDTPVVTSICLAVRRDTYAKIRGFDAGLTYWGFEDTDICLRAWMLGCNIFCDRRAVVGHQFQREFVNYELPGEILAANRIRIARKVFSEPVWQDWLGRFEATLQPAQWATACDLFDQARSSTEEEREYLQGSRVRDEFDYAVAFGHLWPLNMTPSVRSPESDFLRRRRRAMLTDHGDDPQHRHKLTDASTTGRAESDKLGMVVIYLKLARLPSGTIFIADMAFESNGSRELTACASLLTCLIHRMPLKECQAIKPRYLIGEDEDTTQTLAAQTVIAALSNALISL